MPALAAVVRAQVIAHVAHAVRGPGGLDQHQALVGIGDVDHAHGVLVVLLAVLIGKDALGVGREQLEDDVAGVAEDASLAVRAGLGEDGLNAGDEVAEVEHRAGLDIAQGFAQVLAFKHAGGDELEARVGRRLELVHGGAEVGTLFHVVHLAQCIESRGADVGVRA